VNRSRFVSTDVRSCDADAAEPDSAVRREWSPVELVPRSAENLRASQATNYVNYVLE
jgi:hypothetical protein